MRNYLIVSLAALACAGCASNRMDNDWFSTAGTQFSIRKDPIVPVKPQVKEKAKKKDAKAGGDKPKPTYHNNPSLEKLITKYYQQSQNVEEIENKAEVGGQIEAKSQGHYANALIDYRAAGFDASRGICEYALNRLGEAHSDYRFANKTFNVGSGAVSSLMGIFQASATSIAVTATSTALLQAWSQDFEEYAYLTASIGTVGEKVKAAQDAYRKGVEGFVTDPADTKPKDGPKGKYDVTPPRSWSDATLQIQQYNSFCLATGMRALIEKAVGKADVYFDKDTGSVEFFSTQNVQKLKLALRQKELLEQQREIDEAQRQVQVAEGKLKYGDEALERAKTTLSTTGTELKKDKLYDDQAKTVDMKAAQEAVAVANAELVEKGDKPTQADKDKVATAKTQLSKAEDVRDALEKLKEYDDAWRKTTTGQIEAAKERVQKLRAAFGAQPATPAPA